jgi:hypothetical protein
LGPGYGYARRRRIGKPLNLKGKPSPGHTHSSNSLSSTRDEHNSGDRGKSHEVCLPSTLNSLPPRVETWFANRKSQSISLGCKTTSIASVTSRHVRLIYSVVMVTMIDSFNFTVIASRGPPDSEVPEVWQRHHPRDAFDVEV